MREQNLPDFGILRTTLDSMESPRVSMDAIRHRARGLRRRGMVRTSAILGAMLLCTCLGIVSAGVLDYERRALSAGEFALSFDTRQDDFLAALSPDNVQVEEIFLEGRE